MEAAVKIKPVMVLNNSSISLVRNGSSVIPTLPRLDHVVIQYRELGGK